MMAILARKYERPSRGLVAADRGRSRPIEADRRRIRRPGVSWSVALIQHLKYTIYNILQYTIYSIGSTAETAVQQLFTRHTPSSGRRIFKVIC